MGNNLNKGILILFFLTIAIVPVLGADLHSGSNASFGPAPLTVEFNAQSSDSTASYYWNFGDGSSSTVQNPSHTYLHPGIYHPSITASGITNSGVTIQVSDPVIILPVIANFVATPSSGMPPLTVQFTDTSSNNPIQWFWDFGDGSSSTVQNPSHSFAATTSGSPSCGQIPANGIYTVKLTACNTSPNNCGIKTNSIAIVFPPTPVSAFTATPTSGAAPLTVQFTDTSSNNPTIWDWNFGDGSGSGLQNPSHTFTISGILTVTMQSYVSPCNRGPSAASTSIIVGSPTLPTTTTAPNTTLTTATTSTTLPTTSVTVPTTIPFATITQTVTATPSSFHYTPRPTVTTIKPLTSYPTITPTQSSPLGVEIGIIAIISAAFLVMKQV